MEGLIMFENYSRAIQATRTVNGASDIKSDFVSIETRWMAEVQALQSTWSFVERLYALPFLPSIIASSGIAQDDAPSPKATCVKCLLGSTHIRRSPARITSNEGGPRHRHGASK